MAKILVVDDEVSLASLLKRSLERQKHEVVLAATAGEAMECFSRQEFELAIVDLTLPDLSGDELAVQFATARPELRIILFSGYTFQTESLPEAVRPRITFLQKPFPSRALTDLVARLLT